MKRQKNYPDDLQWAKPVKNEFIDAISKSKPGKAAKIDVDPVKKLAEEHWSYNEGLITHMLKVVEYAYKTALIHGVRHGQEIERIKHENF